MISFLFGVLGGVVVCIGYGVIFGFERNTTVSMDNYTPSDSVRERSKLYCEFYELQRIEYRTKLDYTKTLITDEKLKPFLECDVPTSDIDLSEFSVDTVIKFEGIAILFAQSDGTLAVLDSREPGSRRINQVVNGFYTISELERMKARGHVKLYHLQEPQFIFKVRGEN